MIRRIMKASWLQIIFLSCFLQPVQAELTESIFQVPEGAEALVSAEDIEFFRNQQPKLPWLYYLVGGRASSEHVQALKLGLERGDDPNMDISSYSLWNLLIEEAVHDAKPEFLRLLLEYGADPFHPALQSDALAALSVQNNHKSAKDLERTLVQLLNQGVDLNEIPDSSYPGLLGGLYRTYEYHDVIVTLEAKDARLQDSNGVTSLMYLCLGHGEGHDTGNIKALIDSGVDINAKDRWNNTPLHYLLGRNRDSPQFAEVTALLIENGADLNSKASNGRTPLHNAAENGWHQPVGLLADAGADLEIASDDGFTPLMLAALNHQVEAARILISKGADATKIKKKGERTGGVINLVWDSNQIEPLMSDTALKNALALTEMLLAEGASINIPGRLDASGVVATPLAGHLSELDQKTIEKLWDFGARLSPEDYQILVSGWHSSDIMHFAEMGADFEYTDKDGFPFLIAYAKKNQSDEAFSDVISALQRAGRDINEQGPNGATALHEVVESGDKYDRVAWLVRLGANPLLENAEGNSPFEIAAKEGNLKILKDMASQADSEVISQDGWQKMKKILTNAKSEIDDQKKDIVLKIIERKQSS